ncbi:hypothetical protein F2Q69_00049776 [Brassica cretica]|uniref:Uncharacterized protein n=1 Tax=Brassica cretica TaxID=69181 RepID=A0A8S9PLH8_BRACR|nr:hypothetical protein F2Q69_00049776 [Brassica cretica]
MHLSSLQSVDLSYKKVAVGHRRSLFPQFWEAKNVQRGCEHICVDMIPLDSKGYECVFDIGTPGHRIRTFTLKKDEAIA